MAPDEPHKLERRLAWDGLSGSDLERLLSEGSNDADDDCPWQQTLSNCRAALRASWNAPILPVAPNENRPFVDLWWPIRNYAISRLAADVSSADAENEIDARVYDQLADSLLGRLCDIGEQVLWQSFSSKRSLGARLLAHLGDTGDGSSPPVRKLYCEFVRRHRRNGLSYLLAEFPELGRLVGTVFVLWLQGCEEMLRRVHCDREVLARVFSVSSDYRLDSVTQGLSDPHCGGRAVAILRFASSDDQRCVRVVYKPKNMGVDVAYHALIRNLNRFSDLPPMRNLAVHDADGYGYMEFVSHQLCSDEDQLHHFYVNAGRLAALLHWLGCTDCHHENLIACADQLLLIDTETLLEPDLPDHIRDVSDSPPQPEPSLLRKRIESSVLRSGLLPQWLFLGDARKPLDISALGIAPPESAEQLLPGWLGINSDGMMPGRVNRAVEIPTSLPVGIGVRNPFSRHLEAFCSGFQHQSNELIRLRKVLIAEDGPLSQFAGLTRRIVLRATRVYFVIQQQLLEPEVLRSSIAQSLKLEQLARTFLLAEEKPLHWPIFAAEQQQMRVLDIPFFTHAIDGDDLHLNDKGEKLRGFIRSSGLASARDRLQQLDHVEIEFQLRLIRGSAQAQHLDVADSASQISATPLETDAVDPSSAGNGQEAAALIVTHLNELAICDPQGPVEWLGMDLGLDGRSFAFGPVGMSLYGGAIGVACLIERFRDRPGTSFDADALMAAILGPMRELVEQAPNDQRLRWWRDEALGLSGCGGQLLALQLLGESALVRGIMDAARPRFVEEDRQLDILGGCAGLIGPLLRQNNEESLNLALKAGEHLLKHQDEDGGIGAGAAGRPTLGFSHGAAGHAAALARLYEATGQERFRMAALAALNLERSHYCKEVRNWPDYRINPFGNEKERFMVGWCSGAPGIALGRACLWGTDLWDAECVQEISAALDTTAAMPELGTDHLCCGNLGLMLQMQVLCAGPWEISPSVRKRAEEAIERHRVSALQRCTDQHISLRSFGTREGALTLPGFFTGLSGMGIALLEDERSQANAATLLSAGLSPPEW